MTETETGQIQWYLRRAGRQAGPMSSAAVRRLLLQGRLTLDDEVSPDRHSWKPVSSVAEVVPPQMRAGGDAGAAAHDLEKPPLPLTAILVSLALVSIAVGFGIWWGGAIPDTDIDCLAQPAPGVDWRNCRLPGLRAAGMDLRGASLQNADLSGAGLVGSDLSLGNLDYVSLRHADLAYAVLRSASLRGADLRQADLTNADLKDADLRFADLSRAKLHGADLSGAALGNAIWLQGETCAPTAVGSCVQKKATE